MKIAHILKEDAEGLQPGDKKGLMMQYQAAKSLMSQLMDISAEKQKLIRDNPEASAKIQNMIDDVQARMDSLKAEIKVANEGIPGPVRELFRTIEVKCSEAVEVFTSTKKFFYRGVSELDSSMDAFVGRSRENRRPLDSSKAAQKMFDEVLAKAGFTALRGNSLFVANTTDQAHEYGEPYFIFPVDGFEYTWTAEQDLVIYPHHIKEYLDMSKFMPYLRSMAAWYDTDDANQTLAKQTQYSMGVHTAVLAVIKSQGTPSIKQVHYAIDTLLQNFMVDNNTADYPDEFDISKNLADFVDVNKFIAKYQPNNTDLAESFNIRREVAIRGSYYALNYGKFHEYIRRYFVLGQNKEW